MVNFRFMVLASVLILFLCGAMVISEELVADEGEVAAAATDKQNLQSTESTTTTKKSIKKKSTKDWNKIKEEDLDKEWEEGDEEEELEHEFERIQKIQTEKQKELSKALDMNNPKHIKKLIKKGALDTKGGMFFVELKSLQPDGSAWNTEAQDKLASRWSALLRTASLSANVFNLEHGKLLLSVDKGWIMQDVMKFVLSRVEVDKIVKDNKDILPGQLPDEDLTEL